MPTGNQEHSYSFNEAYVPVTFPQVDISNIGDVLSLTSQHIEIVTALQELILYFSLTHDTTLNLSAAELQQLKCVCSLNPHPSRENEILVEFYWGDNELITRAFSPRNSVDYGSVSTALNHAMRRKVSSTSERKRPTA